MSKFERKYFSSPANSKAYRDNWDSVFGGDNIMIIASEARVISQSDADVSTMRRIRRAIEEAAEQGSLECRVFAGEEGDDIDQIECELIWYGFEVDRRMDVLVIRWA